MKAALREECRRRLAGLTPAEIAAASAAATARLMGLPEYDAARVVALFLSFGNEIRTDEVVAHALQAGKDVRVPRVVSTDGEDGDAPDGSSVAALRLARGVRMEEGSSGWMEVVRIASLSADTVMGYRGIREPRAALPATPPDDIDFVLVPGLGFDEAGNRLGRGGGYFDRLLARLADTVVVCGFCFEGQIRREIPVESHDQRVNLIVTESRVIRCRA